MSECFGREPGRHFRAGSIAVCALLAIGSGSAAAGPATHQVLAGILAALPENTWATINTNTFQSVWTPDDKLQDYPIRSDPFRIIQAWSSMAYDSNRGDIIIFGGGHAAHAGNDAYRFRTSTLTWERMSLPSAIRRPGSDPALFETVDGPLHSPIASHLYDNTVFLPIADRVASFGGASYNMGDAYIIETAPGSGTYRKTGPYFLDPSKADANKVGGLDGSGIDPTDLGSRMWENRDNLSAVPGTFLEGSTAYATIGGKDVVFFTSPYTLGLYKYTVNDPANASLDTYELVGVLWDWISYTGSAAYDPDRQLYVRVDGTGLTFWDLSDPTIVKRVTRFDARYADGTSLISSSTSGSANHFEPFGAGIEFDPERNRFLMWSGTGQVFALSAPDDLASPWTVTTLDPSGTPNAPSPPQGGFNGVVGKWDYAPGYDVFFGLTDPIRGDIWVYKPDDWQPSFGGVWAGDVDDRWSNAGNWADGRVPAADGSAVFGARGGDGTTVVDRDTGVANVSYLGSSEHVTEIVSGARLNVDTVTVGYGKKDSATAVWRGGGIVDIDDLLRVGLGKGRAPAADSRLTIDDVTAIVSDGQVRIGRSAGSASGADGTLVIGAAANVAIGSEAKRTDFWIGASTGAGGGATKGLVDAADPRAIVDLRLRNLVVGLSDGDMVTGTLRWNQTEAIDADNVFVGLGKGATGIVDVPTGGTLRLGRTDKPLNLLALATDDRAVDRAGVTTAHLDFSVTNPTFEAFTTNLAIGRRTTSAGAAEVDGKLVLGTNSRLVVGSLAAPGNIHIGRNMDDGSSSGFGSARGVLDLSRGIAEIQARSILVGAGVGGPASGSLMIGDGADIRSTTVQIGLGTGAVGTVALAGGTLVAETIDADQPGSTFTMTGGRLGLGGETKDVGVFTGNLTQRGGILAPGFSRTGQVAVGTARVRGDYDLFSAGALEVELLGAVAGVSFDQLRVRGGVDLNADGGTGGTLMIDLGFAPDAGSSFLIIDNDGNDRVRGGFLGLDEGGLFDLAFLGDTFTFSISYVGGDGNDVVLSVVEPVLALAASDILRRSAPLLSADVAQQVPQPSTLPLLAAALAGLVAGRHMQRSATRGKDQP